LALATVLEPPSVALLGLGEPPPVSARRVDSDPADRLGRRLTYLGRLAPARVGISAAIVLVSPLSLGANSLASLAFATVHEPLSVAPPGLAEPFWVSAYRWNYDPAFVSRRRLWPRVSTPRLWLLRLTLSLSVVFLLLGLSVFAGGFLGTIS